MHKRHMISVLVLGLFVFLALGSIESEEAVEKEVSEAGAGKSASEANNGTSRQIIKIAAEQLFSEYDTNEVAADAKYEEQILQVTGIVDDIGKDITDTMYVALKSGNPIMSVQCMFSEDHESELANVSKGETVTIRGRCDGKMGNVLLRGCQFVSPGSPDEAEARAKRDTRLADPMGDRQSRGVAEANGKPQVAQRERTSIRAEPATAERRGNGGQEPGKEEARGHHDNGQLRRLMRKATKDILEALGQRKYGEAAKLVDAALENPKLATGQERLRGLQEIGKEARSFWGKVLAAAERLQPGTDIRVGGFGGEYVEFAHGIIRLRVGGGVADRPIEKLRAKEAIDLAAKGVTGQGKELTGEFFLQAGVFLIAERDYDPARRCLERAKKEGVDISHALRLLERAKNSD